MELIEWIIADENIDKAIKAVKANKGAPGIDKMPVSELDGYFLKHREEIKAQIRNKEYKPKPVRRVYIPKANGKKRPLGIPTVVDRTVQQMVAQVLSLRYERYFSDHSYGFRPGRDAQMAIEKALEYLNDGYEWVIDLDIEKYFDTVNHDKLITILRERINDAPTLNLIRKFLRAGVLEDGLVSPSEEGVPQGGPLSPVLSNVYLDKFDSDPLAVIPFMESFVGIMILILLALKTKVVRPSCSIFLGFEFYKNGPEWKCMPAEASKMKLYAKTKKILCRKKAAARPLAETFRRLNWLIRGWINYFRIAGMKQFLAKYGAWMRHKVRVVILKQWKKPKTIYKNLAKLNRIVGCNFSDDEIYKTANSSLGLYRRAGLYVMNYALSATVLGKENKDRPGLVDPCKYYLGTI